jgi:hypothetical protein
MRHDEAGTTVFGGERMAIVIESEQHVGTEEIFEGNVGGVASSARTRMCVAGGAGATSENFGEQDTLPGVVEAAPAVTREVEVTSVCGSTRILPG